MQKISNENIENKYCFKSSKKAKKIKKVHPFKKDFDSNNNITENSSIITNLINPEPKFGNISSNLQNILLRYSGLSSKSNCRRIKGGLLNSNKSTNLQSNSPISSVKFTPRFEQLDKIERAYIGKYSPTNKKHKSSKSKKHQHNINYYALHKQIKSDYKEIIKNYIEKPIKMNNVSRKFKIANDYNEINSKIFLYEKDKCLKKMNLTDEIEDGKESFDDANVELALSPINHDIDSITFLDDVNKETKQTFNFKDLNESEKFLANFLYSVK